jgi:hypothetical protein
MYTEVDVASSDAKIRYLLLPRTLFTFLSRVMPVKLRLDPLVKINVSMQISLYDNQRVLSDYIMKNILTVDRISTGSCSAYINMKAGLGKTFLGADLIARCGLRTLWVVPKKPLATQAVRDFTVCFYPKEGTVMTNTPRIGKFDPKYRTRAKKGDPSSNVSSQDITIIVINSAVKQPREFFAGYSLVVLDEAHTYCSVSRRTIFSKIAPAVIGMSATTEDRTDGLDPVAIKALAYDGIIRAEDIPGFMTEDVHFDCNVDAIYYRGAPKYTQALTHPSTGRIFTPYMHRMFMEDPWRTQLIINELRALYDWVGDDGSKHRIYVFCETRAPLFMLHQLLKDSFDVDAPEIDENIPNDDESTMINQNSLLESAGHDESTMINQNSLLESAGHDLIAHIDDVGEFIGGISDSKVRDLRDNARVLLTTYGYSGTGVSIEDATAILFATPRRANMKQILARIMRRGGAPGVVRRIIDIIDQSTALYGQYADRALAYDFYNMNIYPRKVRYNDILI